MKKTTYKLCIALFLIQFSVFAQKSVGIGTDKPNPNAILELNVENPVTNPQGLLLPRLTDEQGTLLGSMLNTSHKGMSAYNTTNNTFYIWDGTQWRSTGSVFTSIVGIGGIIVSSSGNNFTLDGTNLKSQWLSASANQIYTNSFVGIGLANPNGLLQFANINNNRKIVLHEDANNDYQFYGFGIAAGQLRYSVGSTGVAHIFYAATSSSTADELMRIQGNGNIGIGTQVPTEKLVVSGNTSITGALYTNDLQINGLGAPVGSILTVDGVGGVGFGQIGSSSQWLTTSAGVYYDTSVGIGMLPAANTPLSIKSTGTSTKPIKVINSATNFPLFEIDEGSGGNGNLMLYNNVGTLVNQISVTNQSYINGGGNFGIGLFNPNEKLTVQGNSSVTGIGYFSSISGLALNGAPAGSIVTVDGVGKLGFGNAPTGSKWETTASGIYYNTNNVGIGLANPTQGKLVIVEDAIINPGIFVSAGGPLKSVNIQLGRTNIADGGIGIAGASNTFSGIATAGDMIIRSEKNLILSSKGAGNDVVFTTGLPETEKMRILANGNVGIGIINPQSKLDINDSKVTNTNYDAIKFDLTQSSASSTNQGLYLNYSVSGTGTSIFRAMTTNITGSSTSINQVSGNVLSMNVSGSANISGFVASIPSNSTGNKTGAFIQVNGTGGPKNTGLDINVSGAATNYAAILNGGNVGIGTSTPFERLVVVGNLSSTGIGYFGTLIGNNMNGAPAGSIVTVDGVGKLGYGSLPTSVASWQLGGNSVVGLTNFGTLTNFDLPFFTNGSEKMRISTSGNVGIGMTSPAPYKLTIVPSFNNDGILIDNQNNTFDAVFQMKTSTVVDNDAALFLDDSDGQKLKIAVGNTSDDANRQTNTQLVIEQSGNVGIGTTSPNQKLTVQGNTSVTGIGYFGTLIGNNMNGAPVGSIVTVDGVGKLGFGTLPTNTNQWISASANQIYTTSFVGIGTSNPNTTFQTKSTNLTTNHFISAVNFDESLFINFSPGKTGLPDAGIGFSSSGGLRFGSYDTPNDETESTYTEYMKLTSSGNLGIGVPAPNQKLTVQGNTSVTGIGYFGTLIGNNMNGAPVGSIVTVDGVGKLGFGTLPTNTNQWISTLPDKIYTNSFVGIGTNLPNYPLHLVVDNSVDKAMYVNKNVTGTTGPQVAYSALFNGIPTSGTKIGFESSINPTAQEFVRGMTSTINNNSSENDLFASYSYITNNKNGKSTGFFALNDGNGVGSHYGFSASDNSSANGERYGVAAIMSGAGTGTNYAIYGRAINSTANNYAGYFDDGKVYIKDNVGIGTLNPTAKLDVLGTIKFQSLLNGILTVDGTGNLGVGALPSGSQWTTTTNGIFYNSPGVIIGNNQPSATTGLEIDMKATNNIALQLSSSGTGWGSGIRFGNSAPSTGRTYGIYSSSAGRFHFGDVGASVDRMIIDANGNVGIGALLIPTAKLDIQGDAKIASTLTLAGLAGGNYALGVNPNGQVITLTSPVNTWLSTTAGVTYTNDKIAIGSSTVAGAAKFKVAGDGSMGGMVITSQSLINPVSTSNTMYTTLITVPVYIPEGTNTIEFNIIGSSQGSGSGDFQLVVGTSSSIGINMATSTPTIGTATTLNVGTNGWQTLKINAKQNATDAIILHGYTVIVKN